MEAEEFEIIEDHTPAVQAMLNNLAGVWNIKICGMISHGNKLMVITQKLSLKEE